MTEKNDLAQLWNDIVAARKEAGNRMCEAFDESLKAIGPREFCVVDENTDKELWSVTCAEYPSRDGRKPRIYFPIVETEIESASIRERETDRDVVMRATYLDVDDQASVTINGDTRDEELYEVLMRAERGLFNILWPEVDDD